MGLIRLSDAIQNLREELKLAQTQGKNQDIRFDIGSVEIELEVVAEKEVGGSGKINWGIWGGSIDAKAKDVSKHKLKLTLKAVEIKDGVEKTLSVSQKQHKRSE